MSRTWLFLLIIVISIFGKKSVCGQNVDNEVGLQLESLSRMYIFIPDTLSEDVYMQRLNEIEQQVKQMIDVISDEVLKKKMCLIRYIGLLRGPGRYVLKNNKLFFKKMVEEKIQELDLDSSDLELLSGTDMINLINGYLSFNHSKLSDIERATYVLYNIQSEKIRNEYVMRVLSIALKLHGYTDEIGKLIQDIDLCSKTESTKIEAHKLKDAYYPVRACGIAPDFEMEDELGKMVKLSDFKGKMVFIDVWATWCGGCVEGLPYFMALRDQYKDQKDLVLLTISDDGIEAKSRWLKFLKEKKYSGKVPHLIIDQEKDNFTKDYCITGIPRYILIDKEGKIVNAWHVAAKHELFSWFFNMELENMNRK